MGPEYLSGRRFREAHGTIRTVPDGHYFDAHPAAKSRPSEVRLALPDGTVWLRTDRGVFSGRRVDAGTELLLKLAATPAPRGDLLDLGCGYGPIAVTLARRAPGATVWALDVNERALELVRENSAALKLLNIRPVKPDEVPAGVRFAGVWSNPPVRIGKEALHDLLSAWLGRLLPDGDGWLVVHKHLGSDSLGVWLAQTGLVVRRLASRQGYRILEVKRP